MSWRKSSYSGNNGGNCVEAGSIPGRVLARDTQDRAGAVLEFSADAWRVFADQVKQA
ncbi:MAG TPA: DUF397 domain-containing protein [Streptosporangiaceae bacterium]|nr:DUF397 domain-containing protein [Streptosporangiaceae bacterium]